MSITTDNNNKDFTFPSFITATSPLFSPSNSNDHLSENINFFPQQQLNIDSETSLQPPVKFVLTKNESIPPTSKTFLQKKTISNKNIMISRWSKEEQKKFAQAILKYGINWKKIQEYVGTRNMTQIRSHAQKFLIKLKQNKFLLNKGLEKNSTWNKVIEFMDENLNKDEIKNILFSVENMSKKKNQKKRIKYYNKIRIKKEKYLTEKKNLNQNNFINYNKKEEDDEKKFLEYFLQCFNNNTQNIKLNNSFEEEEKDDNDKYINEFDFKFIDFENNKNINFNESFSL